MILVTGASGNIGTAVIELLRHRQVPFRIAMRKPTAIRVKRNATGTAQPQDEIVPFDFRDATTFRSAVQGCHAVFLLRPPAIANTRTTLNPFIDIARAEGIQQIVFVSVAGANSMVPHYAVEQHLHQGASDWAILRPGFFAQNLGDVYREDIVRNDRIFVPAGAGRVAFIDTRDIAEVAVQCLIDPSPHQRHTCTLTGPESLSFSEVASILSDELGRAIAYHAASIPGYCVHLLRRGLPIEQVIVLTILHVGLRFGQAETVDDTLPKLLQHLPQQLRDYVQDARELWIKD